MNAVLIRLIQAALNSLVLPPGIQPCTVMVRMPISGWLAMPFVTVQLELIQQTETAIGEDVINPTADNLWSLFAMAKRTWRIIVTTPTAEERDFYRDSLLSILRILDAIVFDALGLNIARAMQAASYPLARERDGYVPGFYCADIMLQMDGNYATTVLTDYPAILAISSTPTFTPFNATIGLSP